MKSSWLAIALCFTQMPLAQAGDARVVIIADRGSLGRKMATTLRLQLEKPLGHRLGLVANDTYVRRALKLGYDLADLAAHDIAATVGAEIDATHVLVLSGKNKRKHRALLTATLVDVRTGATAEVTTVRVKRRLAKASSSKLVANVMQQVERTAAEPQPEPVAPIAVVSPSKPAVADDGSFDGALPTWADNELRQTVPAANARHGHDDLGLRIAPGAVAFQRECAIRTRDGAEAYRHYRTESFIPGISLDVEMFPFTFDRDKSALDDVGLHARGFATQVASSLPGADAAREVSTVWSADGGLTYRAEIHGWSVAPSMVLRVGYGAFSFPVANEEFPSLMYAGPRGSLRLAATIGGVVILFAEGGYMHPLQVGGDAGSIGRLKTAGTHAYHGEGGLALRLGWFEIGAAARLERFSLAFGGASQLEGLGELYDARVDDRVISGSAWIGLAL